MDFSFIIPCFQASATIGCCLDSIYGQGLDEHDFEVICVDDCSPDDLTSGVIEGYTVRGSHPSNLKLIRHTENRKAGGARNTAIRVAQGDYVLNVDADDYFLDGALLLLLQAKRDNEGLDFIMFNYVDGDGKTISAPRYSALTPTAVMTGTEFLKTQQVPWTPWLYMYRRRCFEDRGIWFPENTSINDSCTVLQFTAEAISCRYVPVAAYCYVTSSTQGTVIGKNPVKIRDLFVMSDKLMRLALQQGKKNDEAGRVLMGHATFHRRKDITRYVWRLSFAQQRSLLTEFAFHIRTNDRFVDFSSSRPLATAVLLTTFRPLIYGLLLIRALVKGIHGSA